MDLLENSQIDCGLDVVVMDFGKKIRMRKNPKFCTMCFKQGCAISVGKLKSSNNVPKEVVEEYHCEQGNTKQLDGYVEIHGQQINQSNSKLRSEKKHY